jgi:hypothetical protein
VVLVEDALGDALKRMPQDSARAAERSSRMIEGKKGRASVVVHSNNNTIIDSSISSADD